LINNAAQTVKRSPGSYSALADAEAEPLPAALTDGAGPERITFGKTSDAHPASLASSLPATAIGGQQVSATLSADDVASLAMVAGSVTAERIENGLAIDAGGLVPDLAETNSWIHTVEQVDPVELLEVQLCNSVAPFILVSRLRASMEASQARRKYVVNVSAMEGQFGRAYKGPGHPHTNMAKAALNMLTRTSAKEMVESGILMTAVDTGWITDERPHPTKMRLADEGFHAPLDLVDGAARVYDPIVQGELGIDLYGSFLKDYQPSPW
ncbi:MAG: short-chain dehydrogenase, partial [Rhodococcus sp.]|nr:short-chain dehydrogenase [Rhodococcus sp. (in: high G+C Gram-positive bacteria)]